MIFISVQHYSLFVGVISSHFKTCPNFVLLQVIWSITGVIPFGPADLYGSVVPTASCVVSKEGVISVTFIMSGASTQPGMFKQMPIFIPE